MRVWLTTENPEAVEGLRKDLTNELNQSISQKRFKSKVGKRKLKKEIKAGDLSGLVNAGRHLGIKVRVAEVDQAGFASLTSD